MSMKFKIIVINVLFWLINTLKVSDFQPSLFKFTSIQQGFRNIFTGSKNNGQIVAYHDLNDDRYTDYIAMQNPHTNTLIFYIWNINTQQFNQYYRKLNNIQNVTIEEIIVYDFDQNDNQIIVTINNGTNFTSLLYSFNCVQCNDNLNFVLNGQINHQTSVPFLINYQENIHIATIQGQSRNLYFYNSKNANFSVLDFSSILTNRNGDKWNLVDKHFAANIDLNNDCHSDLGIISFKIVNSKKIYYLQVYSKASNNKFEPVKEMELPLQIEQLISVSYIDIDKSGSIDLIFLYKHSNETYIKALLNPKRPQQICTTFGMFPSQSIEFNSLSDVNLPINYDLTDNSIPRFGDVNADGLIDILLLMEEYNGFTKVLLLINKAQLNFEKYDDQWNAYDLNNPTQALFYDYQDDGKIDLMILSQERKTINGVNIISYSRTSVINNLQPDTLHLKVLPLSLNGLSSSTFGITIQWLLTDIDGNKIIQIANQKSQLNYGCLQLPYTLSGLGRTNNYVQQLTLGYPLYQDIQDWTPIIPNSQVMVFKDNHQWMIETLLKNNQRVNDVIYVSVLILISMGLVVFYLGYLEAQQDKRDHYNFIQLIR